MTLVFIALVVTLFAAVVHFSKKLMGNRGAFITASALAAWLLTQAVLALNGFFADFSSMPPHIAFVILPGLIFLLGLAVHPAVRKSPGFLEMSVATLIGFQTFRVVMEFILYTLVKEGQLPEIMTLTGSNFDLLVGTTAPFTAWVAVRYGRRSYPALIAWNGAGFLILLNTVIHGILAAPTRFQVFFTDPPNTVIGTFPWIWLPGFVVPVALAGHILSLRQIWLLTATPTPER